MEKDALLSVRWVSPWDWLFWCFWDFFLGGGFRAAKHPLCRKAGGGGAKVLISVLFALAFVAVIAFSLVTVITLVAFVSVVTFVAVIGLALVLIGAVIFFQGFVSSS